MDHAADAHRTDLMTITRFVLNEQTKHPESRGDFTILLSHIVLGCKFVCSAVNKVFLSLFHILSVCSFFAYCFQLLMLSSVCDWDCLGLYCFHLSSAPLELLDEKRFQFHFGAPISKRLGKQNQRITFISY